MHLKILLPIVIIISEFSFSGLLQGQADYQLKTFTSDNGLSHSIVNSIAQDKEGFLWIATWDGLNRYDGYEFKNYFHDPDDSTSLPFFCIDKVLVDKENNIWICCQNKPVYLYDKSRDCFKPFLIANHNNQGVSDIAIGNDNNIWLFSGTDMFRYDNYEKKIRSFIVSGDSSQILYYKSYKANLVFDNNGDVWTFYKTKDKLLIFKGTFKNDLEISFCEMGAIDTDKSGSGDLYEGKGNIDIYVSDTGKTWLFTLYGLYCFDEDNKKFTEYRNPVTPGEFKVKHNLIWADGTTGINIIDSKKGLLINIKFKKLSCPECVFIDKSGIIWSGDMNTPMRNIGLNRYIKSPDYFTHYLTDGSNSSSPNLIFPVLKDKNKDIWVGIRSLGYIIRIKPNGNQERIHLSEFSDSTGPPEVRSMVQDSGGIWLGTFGGKLIYYDFLTRTKECRYPVNNMYNSPAMGIHNILMHNENIVINGFSGVYRYDPESNELNQIYQHKPIGTSYSLINDEKDGFWIGTYSNSVIHLNTLSNNSRYYKIGSENNISEHICVGDSNDIWVALMGGGLGHLYPESGRSETFTVADGLSNNVTYSILKDRKGNLWISTNDGISRFDPLTKQFRNFGKNEGLKIKEFNSDSYFQTPDGEMFFGGVGGLVGFYPDSIDNFNNENLLSNLIITRFKVSGINRYFSKAIYEMDKIPLEIGDNNFQVTFALLDFRNSEKTRYRYRLIGANENWIETDYHNREISYAHLTHHDYKLEIQATNRNGEWTNSAEMVISIPHRFTELLWVRISLILIILSIILLTGFIFYQQERLKTNLNNSKLKMESLRGQMNPHFIFNSLSSINYFISKEDKLSANNYIADFSRLIRSILSNLTNDYIKFEKEIGSLEDYLKLEHLRFGDRFNYTISSDEISDLNTISVYPGMIQPFVENAIWHGIRSIEGRIGLLEINFKYANPGKIQCVIKDDGVGRKIAGKYNIKKGSHNSRGIEIVRERLQIYNNITKNSYQVIIEDLYPDKEETGTKVIVDLPVLFNRL
jgi:ligand-binding sensor domain-containing protein